MTHNLPLIAGAGPTGLAAALFLSHAGIRARVVDAAPSPSPYSRALAVNPRTLELLKPTGVTEKMLSVGRKIRRAKFWQSGRVIADVNLSSLDHEYPFLLALSQSASERLMAEALIARGVTPERNCKLTQLTQSEAGIIEVTLQQDRSPEKLNPPWVLGADGSRSAVRNALGIDFPGSSFPEEWQLADVALETSFEPDCVHGFFQSRFQTIAFIPVIDDQMPHEDVWRIISNAPIAFDSLPHCRAKAEPIWKSGFHIGHHLADRFRKGNVFLAGDAAHIHSPIGARGMNLGIEDAWTFARLMATQTIDRYAPMRREIDAQVIKRVKALTQMIRSRSRALRFLRAQLMGPLTSIPFTRTRILGVLTGLDHALEI